MFKWEHYSNNISVVVTLKSVIITLSLDLKDSGVLVKRTAGSSALDPSKHKHKHKKTLVCIEVN